MKKNGFTLIELVVVIVLLGILAVTAAPKFLNIQTDARNAALEGMKGAIASALEMGYGKMAIAGLENQSYVSNKGSTNHQSTDIPISGCEKNSSNTCIFRFGYPGESVDTLTTVVNGLDNEYGYNKDKDWGGIRENNGAALIITDKSNIDYKNSPPTLINDNCYIRYENALSTNAYSLDVTPCK
ncbi:type II secretion system protein [Photobacterium nomapromontoriensis]|uniref:type II secretion system protein n=1 Tax=Photobacterium nomapromontoriensis TaxID=2910237 RepID=UPI003D14C840